MPYFPSQPSLPSVFIALGSNIDPEDNLKAAATLLREKFPGIHFSSVFRTAPIGHTDQKDFLNAAATFESDASAEEIYDSLRFIELHLKKNPPFPSGPRTIDLDLLLYGDSTLPKLATHNSQPVVPHPRMHERRFVLEPLVQLIDPKGKHPVLGKMWEELLQETTDQNTNQMKITL